MRLRNEVSFPGEYVDTWHGYSRHLMTIQGCNAWVVEPKKARSGNPWAWSMYWKDLYLDRTGVLQLLEEGFYYLFIDIGKTYGCPSSLKPFDALYAAVTAEGLAPKGTLIGISQGGLYAYNWASQNPDKVVCIYGDAPVCDFKSWPAGIGQGQRKIDDWTALIQCYGFKDEAEALAWPKNPIDNLESLAKARIPLIHVVGDVDNTVPVSENTAIIEERYKALKGEITVFHKPTVGHHPHGIDNPAPLVDLILRYTETAIK